ERFATNFLSTLNRLQSTEQFLEKLTHTTFNEISHIADNQRMINIPQLLALDETLRHRILMHWLITENVPFPTTQAFLDELMRFLQNKNGGTHAVHKNWSLVKKQKSAYILIL
ncbi:MAG TPA: hypothetical protein VGW78_00405, partial [Candidatus Babeliales bacterium]|nr:hypothetical protein [Candidatus Babeliales bacterium]